MRKLVLSLAVLLVIQSLAHAASISGDIYDAEGTCKLNNTIIKVEGPVSMQTMASERYNLSLPEGEYILTATHYVQGKIDCITKEKVLINQTDTKFDLILIPYELYALTPQQSDPDLTKLTNASRTQNTTGNEGQKEEPQSLDLGLIALGLILLVMIAGIAYYFVSKNRNTMTRTKVQTESEETKPKTPDPKRISDDEYVPDPEAKVLLKILGENEGRMYQKELRDILNWSEAKMSIETTELERAGYIRRIRKGRDNLIRLEKR